MIVLVLALAGGFFVVLAVALFVRRSSVRATDSHHLALEETRLTLEAARKKTLEIVTRHLETLANRRDVLARVDRYGVINESEWNREIRHFADNVIRPRFSYAEVQAIEGIGWDSFFQVHIEIKVSRHAEQRLLSDSVPPDIGPIEFEGRCAAVLQREGWSASTTSSSGDQGADVIAVKQKRKLVLQCKLYSRNVGNKAVQEVIAARQFYAADYAAVVSVGSFTRSAEILAKVAKVHLIEFRDLANFANTIALDKRLPGQA